MDQYIYRRIDLDRPSIRLCRLLNGDIADHVKVELFDAWLEEGVPYEALSYTWGSKEKPHEITVDGKRLPVTSNLHNALRHLRLETEDRILWVDAICIDQDDDKERSHQVKQMGTIYKQAERVIVWLGLSFNGSQQIMNYMRAQQSQNIRTVDDWEQQSSSLVIRSESSDKNSQTGSQRQDMTMIMQTILSNPWFRRIWILQEIANARSAIIQCGDDYISARVFAVYSSKIGLKVEPHVQAVLDIMPGQSRKESWWSQSREIRVLLGKFSKSLATDERDLVYALLGISSDACHSDDLSPNYEKDLNDVLCDTYRFITRKLSGRTSPEIFVSYTPKTTWKLTDFRRLFEESLTGNISYALRSGDDALMIMTLLNLDTSTQTISQVDSLWATELLRSSLAQNDLLLNHLIQLAIGVQAKDRVDAAAPDTKDIGTKIYESLLRILVLDDNKVATVDYAGRLALSYAVMNRDVDILIRLLLNTQADLEASEVQTNHGTNALCRDTQYENMDISDLLKSGARVVFNCKSGRSVLSYTVEGQTTLMRLLLKHGADVDCKDEEGRTLLSYAAGTNREEVMKLLLDKGAEINAIDSEGRTPLSYAAERKREEVIKLLLDKGAEINAVDNEGRTPLSYAAGTNREEVMRLLLDKGAEINAVDNEGRTPLWDAAKRKRGEVRKLLLDKGAKINYEDNEGRTPLSYAAERKREEVIKLLLDKGAEINTVDNEGRTPLSYAAGTNREEVMKLLLDKGAEINAVDNEGRTPLWYAAKRKRGEVRKLLLDKGAKINYEDNEA